MDTRPLAVPMELTELLRAAWRECGLSGRPGLQHLGGNLYRCPEVADIEAARLLWARLIFLLGRAERLESVLEVWRLALPEGLLILVQGCLVLLGTGPLPAKLPTLTAPLQPSCLALGGDQGTGKSTVLRRLAQAFPDKIFRHRQCTTRPARAHERDGVDYDFRTAEDFVHARTDPAAWGHTEYRGSWYWYDLCTLLENVHLHPARTHVFKVCKRTSFENLRVLFPELRWIWLETPRAELQERRARGASRDSDPRLKPADPGLDDLIDLRLVNPDGHLERTVVEVVSFLQGLHAL